MPRRGANYESVSLPKDLVDDVAAFIESHPRMGYSSIADLVKSAIRLRIAVDVQVEDVKRDAAEAIADRSVVQLQALRRVIEAEGLSRKRVTAEELLARIEELMTADRTRGSPGGIKAWMEWAVLDFRRHLLTLAEGGQFPKDAVENEVTRFRRSTRATLDELDRYRASQGARTRARKTRGKSQQD